MTISKGGGTTSGGNNDNANMQEPPERQSRLPKKSKEPFSTEGVSNEVKSIVKLTVEFPLKVNANQPNDLALMFKRFAKKLLTVDRTALILNWDHPEQNPIEDADDIECKESVVKQYYNGSRILTQRGKSWDM